MENSREEGERGWVGRSVGEGERGRVGRSVGEGERVGWGGVWERVKGVGWGGVWERGLYTLKQVDNLAQHSIFSGSYFCDVLRDSL